MEKRTRNILNEQKKYINDALKTEITNELQSKPEKKKKKNRFRTINQEVPTVVPDITTTTLYKQNQQRSDPSSKNQMKSRQNMRKVDKNSSSPLWEAKTLEGK